MRVNLDWLVAVLQAPLPPLDGFRFSKPASGTAQSALAMVCSSIGPAARSASSSAALTTAGPVGRRLQVAGNGAAGQQASQT